MTELTNGLQNRLVKSSGLSEVCLDDSHTDLLGWLDDDIAEIRFSVRVGRTTLLLIEIDRNALLANGEFGPGEVRIVQWGLGKVRLTRQACYHPRATLHLVERRNEDDPEQPLTSRQP